MIKPPPRSATSNAGLKNRHQRLVIMGDEIRVGELFAGVGGFRLGLEGPPSEEWETEFLKFEETGSGLFGATSGNQVSPTRTMMNNGQIEFTSRDLAKMDTKVVICTTLQKVLKQQSGFLNSMFWSADSPARTIRWPAPFPENWALKERKENSGDPSGRSSAEVMQTYTTAAQGRAVENVPRLLNSPAVPAD